METSSVNNGPSVSVDGGLQAGLALGSSAMDLANTGLQFYGSAKNLAFQQGVFEYQKALQEKLLEREDTAFRRHLNDVTKAGFSPLAALGGSASAGQAVSVSAPKMDIPQFDSRTLATVMGLTQAQEQIDLQRAQTEAQIRDQNYNYEFYSSRNLPLNANMYERLASTLLETLGVNYNNLPDILKTDVEKISDTVTKAVDAIGTFTPAPPPVANTVKTESDMEKYFYNSDGTVNKEPSPAPKIANDEKMYWTQAHRLWKNAYNDVLSTYGDLAHYDKVDAWLKANPEPKFYWGKR